MIGARPGAGFTPRATAQAGAAAAVRGLRKTAAQRV